MATNRKLGKTTDIRLSMLKTQVTDLLWHGKIETTETRAKETKEEIKLQNLQRAKMAMNT